MKGKKWTEEEDFYLRDEVLKSIREGDSQLNAFERVGKKLGRTPGACGFRWNAVLRQQNPVAYMEAKKKRVRNQLEKRRKPLIQNFESLYRSLVEAEKHWEQMKKNVRVLQHRVDQQQERLDQLRKENEKLRKSDGEASNIQMEMLSRYQELLNLVKKLQQQGEARFATEVDSYVADDDTSRKTKT